MEFAVLILKKLFGFFVMHFKLASRDMWSQWKVDTIIECLPTPKELRYMMKRKLLMKQSVSKRF
jgi:hypothetical protein